jgi:hypothetical protein
MTLAFCIVPSVLLYFFIAGVTSQRFSRRAYPSTVSRLPQGHLNGQCFLAFNLPPGYTAAPIFHGCLTGFQYLSVAHWKNHPGAR